MANVKRVYYDGALIYPLTVTDAVINAETKEQLSSTLKRLEEKSYDAITEQEIRDLMKDENSQ